MLYVEMLTLAIFIVLITVGYRKNNRNIMLMASLCLLMGFAGPDFVTGFVDGYGAAKGA